METIIKIYKAMISWLGHIAPDKLLHFIAGALIAAFFALVIPCTAGWCLAFAIAAGIAKEAFDQYLYKGWNFIDLAYTVAGGLIVQLFAWI